MKRLIAIIIICLLPFLESKVANSQGQNFTQTSCFSAYVKKGDEYRTLRNFELAIQQYQAAKQCRGITRDQSIQLDSLINLTKQQQNLKIKQVIRRV